MDAALIFTRAIATSKFINSCKYLDSVFFAFTKVLIAQQVSSHSLLSFHTQLHPPLHSPCPHSFTIYLRYLNFYTYSIRSSLIFISHTVPSSLRNTITLLCHIHSQPNPQTYFIKAIILRYTLSAISTNDPPASLITATIPHINL